MANNQKNNDGVGDKKSPALRPDAAALRDASDQAMHIAANAAPKAPLPSKVGNLADGIKTATKIQPPPGSCVQTLWFSFFFDGTGNNLDADVGTAKHSNVAKLYRVHKENDTAAGIYRFYIPGVGTYFKEVGDDGGSTLGGGAGDMGDDRMDWALKQFDEKMKAHIARAANPANAIVEINLSAFGFSRGAALARAFINNFVKKRCKKDAKNVWRLTAGDYKLRVRFMGLFDTVASVGLAMSANNTSKVGTIAGSVQYMIYKRLNDQDYLWSRPQVLAFAKNAQPGADPAPGMFNGHQSWGGDMQIPEMVEEVRHFVAAHEIRNSFPLDSVSVREDTRIIKPEQFYEAVYPGVHSDVGGSYRPGEGARNLALDQKLGLIPLMDMYQFALAKEVPLLLKSTWKDLNEDDFRTNVALIRIYNYYVAKIPTSTNVLGDHFNAHMEMYYAWRFRAIRQKQQGDTTEAQAIKKNDATFKSEEKTLKTQIAQLEANNAQAGEELRRARTEKSDYLMGNYGNPDVIKDLDSYDDKISSANRKKEVAQDSLLRAKAKLDALPKEGNLQSMLDLYDKQLLQDAKAIYQTYTSTVAGKTKVDVAKRNMLRPHYKRLMTAYENEYIHHKGLTDQTIIAFFDNYVHDSLAGFAKDATLPSDPRVIYLGGNEKYRYAKLRKADDHIALTQEESIPA